MTITSFTPATASTTERQVWLLRHGETAYNLNHRLQGHLDLPLNERGRQQARSAGKFLSQNYQPEHFICSDLARACETAALALPAAQWRIDRQWRERHLGRLQGLTRQETEKHFPEDEQARRSDELFRIPGGGESGIDLRTRITTAAHALPAGRSLIVTHGGVIQAMLRWILGTSPVHPLSIAINNGSLHCFSSGPQGWRVEHVGLAPLAT